MRFLEQENEVLETISRTSAHDLQPFFESHTSCLQVYLDRLLRERGQLDGELSTMQTLVEEYKRKRVMEVLGKQPLGLGDCGAGQEVWRLFGWEVVCACPQGICRPQDGVSGCRSDEGGSALF